jgi:hypothetical protein
MPEKRQGTARVVLTVTTTSSGNSYRSECKGVACQAFGGQARKAIRKVTKAKGTGPGPPGTNSLAAKPGFLRKNAKECERMRKNAKELGSGGSEKFQKSGRGETI